MSVDVNTLSFEAARAELEAVVERLESGAPTLEESLVLWERGESLHGRCRTLLDDAQARLDALRAAPADPATPDADTSPGSRTDHVAAPRGDDDALPL